MDFEDPTVWGLSALFWLFIVVVVWKMSLEGLTTFNKVILTVLSPVMIVPVVAGMLDR